MKFSPNAPCPCGSATKTKKCCGLYHRGRPAPPLALMRARYCAYATGNVAFLIDTTHPDGPHARDDRSAWRDDLAAHCRATQFLGLTIHSHEVDEENGRASVRFTARMQQADKDVGFTEHSLFLRDGRRWKYHSGEIAEPL